MTQKHKADKNETKTETKAEPKVDVKPSTPVSVEAAPETAPGTAMEATKSTPATRPRKQKPARGLMLMAKDPAELDDEVTLAMEALVELSSDSTLPAQYQKVVASLVHQASTEKPGMEEVVLGWKIPLIQINQPTTTATARPEGIKLGGMFTSEGKVLETPFSFLVFALFQENVNFPQGAKVPACSAPDAQLGNTYGRCESCPHLPMGLQKGPWDQQKVTDCQNQITAVVATTDLSKVYMVRFAKTSRKAGSALQSLAGAGDFPWSNNFLLSTEKGPGTQGNYFIFKVEPTGKPNDEHACRIAQTLCNLYRAERDRALADHYRAASSAPAVAAAAESAFEGSKLDAGLAGETEAYDLGEASGTPPASAGSVRSAAKPM